MRLVFALLRCEGWCVALVRFVASVQRVLRELVSICDAKAYKPSGSARTVGARRRLTHSCVFYLLCCDSPASVEALLAGNRMPTLARWSGLAIIAIMRLSQSAVIGCYVSGALVQSWENFQRGLVART